MLETELSQLQEAFPDQFPPFRKDEFFTHSHSHSRAERRYYNIHGILSHLGMIIGRIKVLVEVSDDLPVTESRELSFISNKDLMEILQRDYKEIQRAFVSQCWKSVIVLCGSALEAILVDILEANPLVQSAKSAPKQADISKWNLVELINVSVELTLVSPGIEKFSHSLREYRNIIHPGNEMRYGLTFDSEEARIALEVLNIIIRDLEGNYQRKKRSVECFNL